MLVENLNIVISKRHATLLVCALSVCQNKSLVAIRRTIPALLAVHWQTRHIIQRLDGFSWYVLTEIPGNM